jgi:hypothetical protein
MIRQDQRTLKPSRLPLITGKSQNRDIVYISIYQAGHLSIFFFFFLGALHLTTDTEKHGQFRGISGKIHETGSL